MYDVVWVCMCVYGGVYGGANACMCVKSVTVYICVDVTVSAYSLCVNGVLCANVCVCVQWYQKHRNTEPRRPHSEPTAEGVVWAGRLSASKWSPIRDCRNDC